MIYSHNTHIKFTDSTCMNNIYDAYAVSLDMHIFLLSFAPFCVSHNLWHLTPISCVLNVGCLSFPRFRHLDSHNTQENELCKGLLSLVMQHLQPHIFSRTTMIATLLMKLMVCLSHRYDEQHQIHMMLLFSLWYYQSNLCHGITWLSYIYRCFKIRWEPSMHATST